jgi:hypothetical protein
VTAGGGRATRVSKCVHDEASLGQSINLSAKDHVKPRKDQLNLCT